MKLTSCSILELEVYKVSKVVLTILKTLYKYKRISCLGLGNSTPPYMSPVQDGSLIQLIAPGYLSPAEAPYPYHEGCKLVTC